MYSLEKLAKGGRSRLVPVEFRKRKYQITKKTEQEIITRNKYENNFSDPRKYFVQEELFEDRPRDRICRSKIRKR